MTQQVTPVKPRAVSRFAADLLAGRFVVTGEVAPPTSARLGAFFRRAEAVSRFARAITVTNNHGGAARLGSLVSSGFLSARGIEPIWVMLARDQNRLALQSDLIAAEALNVRNILCLQGDQLEEQTGAKPVNHVGTLGLLRIAAERRNGGAPFFIGSAVDLNSVPAAKAAEQAARRLEAGAHYLLTQPVYEASRVEEFLEETAKLRLPPFYLVVGMMPMLSRDAVERVPSRLRIIVAESILRRIHNSDDPKAEGLAVLAETLATLRSFKEVHGVNLMLFGFQPAIAEEVAALIRSIVSPPLLP